MLSKNSTKMMSKPNKEPKKEKLPISSQTVFGLSKKKLSKKQMTIMMKRKLTKKKSYIYNVREKPKMVGF